MRSNCLHAILIALAMFPAILSAQDVNYKPELYGLVKARFETATISGDMRFNVRNTRLGVRGMATRNMGYAIQMELNSQGSFSVLDTYLTYKIGNFDVSLGQQQYKFSTELNRGSGSYFANRSFVAKFISDYYSAGTAPVLDAIGARDIGIMADYRWDWKIPVAVHAGLFNGRGVNDPAWQKHVNFVGRVDVGGETGLQVSGSYYTGKTRFGSSMNMWGAEARYVTEKLIVEAEVAMRYHGLEGNTDVMKTAVIHAMYSFDLPENVLAKNITPQLRWDVADNVRFMNMNPTPELERFDGHRLTAGLVIGLTDKMVKSELRFNYEYYLPGSKPSDYGINPLFQDKFTIEFFARF